MAATKCMGISYILAYVHCPAKVDDAEHTLFACLFWVDARSELSSTLGRSPLPENLIELLCTPSQEKLPTAAPQRGRIMVAAIKNKELFLAMVESIFGHKESLERIR